MTEKRAFVREITADEYGDIFGNGVNFFGRRDFAMLNRAKAEKVVFLALENEKGRTMAGITAGVREGRLYAPFSAPYCPLSTKKALSVERARLVASALREYSGGRMRLTLPPLCYGEERLSLAAATLMSAGAEMMYTDYNYHIALRKGYDAAGAFSSKAGGHLRHAIAAGVKVEKRDARDADALKEAYEVIRTNRTERGFPLRMSLAEVESTIALAGGKIFTAYCGNEAAAAAILFDVEPRKAQLIYWGNVAAHNAAAPMYPLAAAVADALADEGYDMVDLGPSSEEGIPAAGQCAFKESVGGKLSLKFTLHV